MEYILITNKNDIRLFLELLIPHLKLKREKAYQALEFMEDMKNHVRCFNQQEEQYIENAYESKTPCKTIAHELGCKESKIYRYLRGKCLIRTDNLGQFQFRKKTPKEENK